MARTDSDSVYGAPGSVTSADGPSIERDAENSTLRRPEVAPLSTGEALELEGSGWDGDLDDMGAHRLE